MRSETILGVDRAMNRQNTLLIRAVVSSDGTKRLVKKVSVGKIGVDVRIVWFVQETSGGAWTEISAEEALNGLSD